MNDVFEELPGGDDRTDVPAGPTLDTESLVNQALDLLASAKTMPLSSSVLVSRDELTDLLTDAVEQLPDELRQARWLLREREEFLAERQREADALMDEVRARAEHMVSRTEVVRQAHQTAQRILDDARDEARQMRHEAEDYCDQRLAGMEIVLERIMRTVQAGRHKLQASASPAEPRPGPVVPDGEEPSRDGFFDQDLA
ncbi:MAG: ATPase [Acidimicrobiales bacterium]